jgi:hypothetical protein
MPVFVGFPHFSTPARFALVNSSVRKDNFYRMLAIVWPEMHYSRAQACAMLGRLISKTFVCSRLGFCLQHLIFVAILSVPLCRNYFFIAGAGDCVGRAELRRAVRLARLPSILRKIQPRMLSGHTAVKDMLRKILVLASATLC